MARRKTKSMVIPFNGPAYSLDPAFLSSQICRNYYLRRFPHLDSDSMILFGTPGFVEWLDLGVEVEIRGSLVFGGYLYVVGGDTVYRIDTAKSVTELGSIGTTTKPVGIATNGLDLIVVDGTGGWVWDFGTEVWAEITDVDFPLCKSVVVSDGYYLVPALGTGQIWRSDFNDGLSWGGLAFSTAGAHPDNIVAIWVDNKDIYTVGETSTEIWTNAGLATFNFVPISPAFIQKGGVGYAAVAGGNNAIYWVGKDRNGQGQVFQCIGRVPKNVATPAIVEEIQGWGDLSDIQMFTYEQLDHTHVVITSPSAGKTLVFDSTMAEWHERSSRTLGVNGCWRIATHSLFHNLHIVGDNKNGKLYELKTDVYDENGELMVAVRRTPVIRDRQERITINNLKIITNPGVGLITGDDSDVDPQMVCRWSKDAGRTWSAGVDVSLGKIGDTENSPEITQLGQGKNWVFEITTSARVKRLVMGAVAEIVIDD